jgi:hypothetical protein
MALLDKLVIAEETPEEIDPDPAPDEKPVRRRSTRQKQPTPKIARPAARTVNAMAKEVGNDLATLLEMTAAVWGVRDQCCSPVLAAQSKDIGQALAQILARNPELLRKFANAETGVFVMQCLALGKALLPVGQAVARNHVMKQDEELEQADLATFPAFTGSNGAYPA